MEKKIDAFKEGKIDCSKLMEIFQGWNAHAKWANTYKIRKSILKKINKAKSEAEQNLLKQKDS